MFNTQQRNENKNHPKNTKTSSNNGSKMSPLLILVCAYLLELLDFFCVSRGFLFVFL